MGGSGEQRDFMDHALSGDGPMESHAGVVPHRRPQIQGIFERLQHQNMQKRPGPAESADPSGVHEGCQRREIQKP